MKTTLLSALILAAGCAAPRPEREVPAQPPPPVNPGDRPLEEVAPSQDDKPVAFIDKEPVTWRTVVEHSMNVRGKELIDKYIYWKLRNDRLEALGIKNTPEELRRRAQMGIDAHEKEIEKERGPGAFQKMLEQLKTTKEERVKAMASSAEFDELLKTEKAVVYALLTEAAIEIDTVAFTDREEAAAFAALANRTSFGQAVENLQTAGNVRGRVGYWPRHRFPEGLAPEVIAAAPELEKKLFAMGKGQTSGVESAKGNIIVVVNIVDKHPAVNTPYAELAPRISAEVLRSPPGSEQLNLWMDRLFKLGKVSYENRYTPGNKGR